jgi:hypothetical protein
MIKDRLMKISQPSRTKEKVVALQAWLFAFLLFIEIPPFYVWGQIEIVPWVVLFCHVLILCNIELKKRSVLIFFIAVLLYFFYAYRSQANLRGTIFISVLPIIFLCKDIFLLNVFKKFTLIYSLTLIPSILVYLLVYVFGVSLSYSELEPLNELKSNGYFQYPFFVQADVPYLMLPRFFAYYDEPGVVGTISGVLLAVDKFNFKKKVNIPILIAGIFSFSFAFYIIMFIIILFFVGNKYKIAYIVAAFFIVFVFFAENEELNSYILDRFEIVDNRLSGDNRTTEDFRYFYDKFKQSNSYYWGIGRELASMYNFGGASYKDLIVANGIVFFVIYCLLFFMIDIVAAQGINKNFFLLIFLFVAIIYQRPFISQYVYLFLLYIPSVYLKFEKELIY